MNKIIMVNFGNGIELPLTCPEENINDAIRYISEWRGSPISLWDELKNRFECIKTEVVHDDPFNPFKRQEDQLEKDREYQKPYLCPNYNEEDEEVKVIFEFPGEFETYHMSIESAGIIIDIIKKSSTK